MKEIIESTKRKVKYWWVSLIIGILAFIVGILCSIQPFLTVGMLTIFFIANFIVSGIMEIIFAISNKDNLQQWGWTLAGGIVDLIFAVLLIAMPIGSIIVFIFFVGFYILLQAFMAIWGSLTLKQIGLEKWWYFLILAILGVILGIIMILNIKFAISFITIIFAASLICYGLFRIFYAFKLRKLKDLF